MVGHIVKVRFSIFLLSVGMAAAFFYAGISAFRHPDAWMGALPELLRDNPLSTGMIQGFAAVQIALAVWLVSGMRTVFAAIASIILTATMMFANPGGVTVTFQDISLIFSALALAVLAR